jgi:hypothetical protein
VSVSDKPVGLSEIIVFGPYKAFRFFSDMGTPTATQHHKPKNLFGVVLASGQEESVIGDGEELLSEILVEVDNERDQPEAVTTPAASLDVFSAVKAALMPRRLISRGKKPHLPPSTVATRRKYTVP